MSPLGTAANTTLLRSNCANRPNDGPPVPATGAPPLGASSGIPARGNVKVGVVVLVVTSDTDARSIIAPTASLFSLVTQYRPQCCSALKPNCGPMKSLRILNVSKPDKVLVKSVGNGMPSDG